MKINCVKYLSILLVAASLLTACGKSSESSSQQSSQPEQKSEQIPNDLSELENNIESIVKTLGGPAVQNQLKQGESSSSQSGQNESSSSQSESSSSQSSQSQSSQQGSQSSQQGQSQQKQAPSSKTQDPMSMITPVVEKMHYQWNNLMPLAIQKGANKDLINNVDNTLNQLSNTVTSKDKTKILLAANNLYAYIPDLYSLFGAKSSIQIKRVRYYSRSAVLNSMTNNWKKVDSDIGSLKSVWQLYKNAIGKDQQEMASKLDLSIYELEKVIKERNPQLISTKGKVELSNTESLEKAAQSSSSSQSESSGSSGESSQAQSGSQQSGGSQSSK